MKYVIETFEENKFGADLTFAKAQNLTPKNWTSKADFKIRPKNWN